MASFATEVKNEVASTPMQEIMRIRVELMALGRMNGLMSLSHSGACFELRTENAKVASRAHRMIKQLFAADIEFVVSRKIKLNKNNVYIVKVVSKVKEVIESIHLLDVTGFTHDDYEMIKKSEQSTKDYLRGCFLASGSVNSPVTSNYHLEISVEEEKHAKYIANLMTRFELSARIIMRRKHYIIYLKASDKIADFLKVIGSNQGVLVYERERAERDFLNSINRLDNCEIANDMKAIVSGQKQIEDILLIDHMMGLDKLEDKMQLVAKLRLENPEMNLKELCQVYQEQTKRSISKSGMYHRINKLTKLAHKMKPQEEKNAKD